MISPTRRLLLFVFLLAATAAPGLAKEKASTVYPAAILAFDERGSSVKDFGTKVSDLLFARLAANPTIYLVDRVDMQKTLAEQSLNVSGVVDPAQAVQVGRLTGAQLLVTGSVIQVDKQLILVAKIIGTQSSRVLGTTAEGKITDDLAPLVGQLAEGIAKVISEHSGELVPEVGRPEDRLAKLKASMSEADKKSLPSLWIKVEERHIGRETIDPAVETELGRFASELGFTLIDPQEGTQGQADVVISGEGFSELAGRVNNLVAVKARVELKVTDRATGKLLFVDRQTTVTVDLAEQIAGKTALQEAGAILAERALPKIAQVVKPVKETKKKKK